MSRPCAVVTGATGGIGRWIGLGLADAGYRLFLVGRDPSRLQSTTDWIASRLPAPVETITADLSLLCQTRAAAAAVRARTGRLDLLVNNAGTLSQSRVETAEGHELTLAVNHLAPFVLTRALLPLLCDTAGARVVNVGSSTADRACIDPDDLELVRHWRMVRAYSRSKLALLMTSFALARSLPGISLPGISLPGISLPGISLPAPSLPAPSLPAPSLPAPSLNVVHPGTVATGLVRNPGVVGLAWKLMAPFLLSECQGAAAPLHAALSPDCARLSGCYLKRGRPAAPNRLALDPALCSRVLESTVRLVDETGPG